jgi:nitrogen fixation/metabolism regulation signal transduction histidine kinase
MLIVAFAIAFSSYITKSLKKTISDRLNETSFNCENKKVIEASSSKEINLLISAYNRMVDELEISAVKLAQSEREEEGAKWQKVVHEIKPASRQCA